MSEPVIFNDAFLAMGTQCELVLLNVDENKARDIFAKAKAEVGRIEDLLNRFIVNSSANKLANAPLNEWIKVDDELWDILTICYDFYQISSGAFDITVAPIVALWEEKKTPSEQEIEAAKLHYGFDKVEFDFDKQKIRIADAGFVFDFGAIEKGYALDVLKPKLAEWGVKDAIVSFGEDAVLALGTHPNGGDWPIGIRNQRQPLDFVHVFAASNQTVSSFGEAEKPGISDEATKTYTISPVSGQAITEPRTISVKSDSGMVGAFMATCFLVLDENDRAILSENFKLMEIFEATYLENDIQSKLSIINENSEQ